MLQTELNIYSDGGSRNNPGKAACAFVAFDSHGNLIHQEYKYLGITTNNIADYIEKGSAMFEIEKITSLL